MKKNGFTLVEMSMVLLIIAVITGSIVTADSMRTTYKIRGLIEEFNYYTRAIRDFQTIYNYLPGDFPNAASLFGGGTTNNCANSLHPTGCNGDGDGIVDGTNASGLGNFFGYEGLRFWQHLALAGLIIGNYNNANTIPALRVPRSAIEFRQLKVVAALSDNGLGANYVVIGSPSSDATNYGFPNQTGGTYTNTGFNLLKPLEAQIFDAKIDDGYAYSGKILGLGNVTYTDPLSCSYMASDVVPSQDYQLQNTKAGCILISNWNQ